MSIRDSYQPAGGKAFDSQGNVIDLYDATTQAMVIANAEACMLHKGYHFFIKEVLDFTSSGEEIDFYFKTPSAPIEIHARFQIRAEAEFSLSVYEDTTVSAPGTAIIPLNSNRNSSLVIVGEAYIGPTVSGLGLCIWADRVGSGKDALLGNNMQRGVVLKCDSSYLVRLKHLVAGSHYADVLFSWFELGRTL